MLVLFVESESRVRCYLATPAGTGSTSHRKHLIVAIGSECYVTLPKGQIIPTHSDTYTPLVPGGGHVLIVPITHYPTFSTIPSDLAEPIVSETERQVRGVGALDMY